MGVPGPWRTWNVFRAFFFSKLLNNKKDSFLFLIVEEEETILLLVKFAMNTLTFTFICQESCTVLELLPFEIYVFVWTLVWMSNTSLKSLVLEHSWKTTGILWSFFCVNPIKVLVVLSMRIICVELLSVQYLLHIDLLHMLSIVWAT